VINTTPRPIYPREKPGSHCIGGWFDPRAGRDVCEKSYPTRIRSPDRPARSEWLYRLRYPGPSYNEYDNNNNTYKSYTFFTIVTLWSVVQSVYYAVLSHYRLWLFAGSLNMQSRSGVHPASCSVDTGTISLGVN